MLEKTCPYVWCQQSLASVIYDSLEPHNIHKNNEKMLWKVIQIQVGIVGGLWSEDSKTGEVFSIFFFYKGRKSGFERWDGETVLEMMPFGFGI